MLWKIAMRPGSFRGVPFEIASRDATGGRRIVQHVYPSRDHAYNEDMGLAPRSFSVDAFLVGGTYPITRMALRAALEEEGAGAYVDPWRGTIKVRVSRYSESERLDMGGYCQFRIEFIEEPTPKSTSSLDTVFNLLLKAQRVVALVQGIINRVRMLASLPGWAFAQVTGLVGGMLGALVGSLQGMGGLSAGSGMSGMETGSIPEDITDTISADLNDVSAPVAFAAADALAAWADDARPIWPETPLTPDRAAVLSAGDDLALAALALAAAETANAIARYDFATDDEAARVKVALMQRIDAAQWHAEADLYMALDDLRAAADLDIDTRAANAPKLTRVAVPTTLPALAVSYRTFGSIAPAADLVTRNRIRHPGFIVPATYKVIP